jgi:TatA/E family protein of Tat protein translocase
MPFNIGPGELIIVLIIALVVVGPGKLPDVGSALGKSIREFRKAATDVKESTSLDLQAPAAAPAAAAPAAAAPLAQAAAATAAVPPAPAMPAAAVAAAPAPVVPAATAVAEPAGEWPAEAVPVDEQQPTASA